MDRISNCLDFLTMNYFDGIRFICYGRDDSHKSFSDKIFEGYYGIQFNHHGTFAFSVGNAPLKNYTGSYAFITYPGPRFRYGSPAEHPEGRGHNFICFAGPRTGKYIKQGLLQIPTANQLIKIHHNEKFLATMDELRNCLKYGRSRYDRAVNLLESLLLQLQEQDTSGVPEPYWAEKIDDLALEINQQPEKDWNFEKLAGKLNVSYSHLRRIFRQATGCPLQKYLNVARLERAAMFLRDTDEPVKVIAGLVGIDDNYYFSRAFKKHFYMSPQAYRREFGNF